MRAKDKYKDNDFLERHFCDRFLSFCENMPSGTLEKSEAPDFLLYTATKVIGIEVTQIHNEPAKGAFPPAQKHDLEDKILVKAEELFLDRNNVHLHIRFHFAEHFRLPQRHVDSLALTICELIENEVKGKSYEALFNFYIEDGLPSELVCISGHYFPNITDTVWYSGKGMFLPHLSKKQLLSTIAKKEREVGEYKKKADELILLLVEGLTPYSFFDQVQAPCKEEVSSGFDKIFLMRNVYNNVLEIK